MALLFNPLVTLLVATVPWAVPKDASVGRLASILLRVTSYFSSQISRVVTPERLESAVSEK